MKRERSRRNNNSDPLEGGPQEAGDLSIQTGTERGSYWNVLIYTRKLPDNRHGNLYFYFQRIEGSVQTHPREEEK